MPEENGPVPVALIGTGARSSYMYGPLVQALPQETRLVSVWGRSEPSARALGTQLGVPWYTDIDRLARETGPGSGSCACGARPTDRWA